jgi:ABC-type nickel/cobalt efflux system permease component RcnA
MPVWGWVVLAAAVVVVVVLLAWLAWRTQRTRRLESRFGPEYERTLEEREDRREAEADLTARQRRRSELEIKPLEPGVRHQYAEAWQRVQTEFVDQPVEAVRSADRLVMDVMRERGYPMEDFDQRAADVSVDHPHIVDNYRAAHHISLTSDRNEATTEDLRKAMVHYRSLFSELLEERREEQEAR